MAVKNDIVVALALAQEHGVYGECTTGTQVWIDVVYDIYVDKQIPSALLLLSTYIVSRFASPLSSHAQLPLVLGRVYQLPFPPFHPSHSKRGERGRRKLDSEQWAYMSCHVVQTCFLGRSLRASPEVACRASPLQYMCGGYLHVGPARNWLMQSRRAE